MNIPSDDTMPPLAGLREHLLSCKTTIIDRWHELSTADDELDVVGRLTRDEFRNNMPAALDALCDLLISGEEQVESELDEEVGKHGHHRWKQGFSLRELIRDWGHFNRVLTETIDEYFGNGASESADDRSAALQYLANYLLEAASHSVERFDELRRAEAASLVTDLEIATRHFEEVTQARGTLLRQIAHDIRGGLSSVTGASSYLRAAGAEPGTLTEMLDVLDSGVQSVLEMLNSLLDLSRLESGAEQRQLQRIDVGQMLVELSHEVEPTAREKGLKLVVQGDRDLVVQTDAAKVRRIAQNLLVNAIKYTISGEVRIDWELAKPSWLLRIEDTGPGIQDVIGSPVAQELDDADSDSPATGGGRKAAYQGEGIGLTIVKQLCTLLDAGVSMESEIGRGTKFTIEFPLVYESSASDSE